MYQPTRLMQLQKILQLVLCISLLWASSVSAVTFFVSTSGNDSNSGTSEGQAWRTLAKVSNHPLNSGDVVRFRGGDVWFVTNGDGSDRLRARAGVTYTNFGSGRWIVDGNFQGPASSNSATFQGLIHVNRANNVTVENFITRNSTEFGIRVEASNDATIRFAESHNNTRSNFMFDTDGRRALLHDVHSHHHGTPSFSPHESIDFAGVHDFEAFNVLSEVNEKSGFDIKDGATNGLVHHMTIISTDKDPQFYIERAINIEAHHLLIINHFTDRQLVAFAVEGLGPESSRFNQNVHFHHNLLVNASQEAIAIFLGGGGGSEQPWEENGPNERRIFNLRIEHNTIFNTNTTRVGEGFAPTVIGFDSRPIKDSTDIEQVFIRSNLFVQLNTNAPPVDFFDGTGSAISPGVTHNLYPANTSIHSGNSELGTNTVFSDNLQFFDANSQDFRIGSGSAARGIAHDGTDAGALQFGETASFGCCSGTRGGGSGGGGGGGGGEPEPPPGIVFPRCTALP